MRWFRKWFNKDIGRLEFQLSNRNDCIDELIKEKCDLERELSDGIKEKAEDAKLIKDDANKSVIIDHFPIGIEFEYLLTKVRVIMHEKTRDLTHHYGPNATPAEYYGIKVLYVASDGTFTSQYISVDNLHAIVADKNSEVGASTELDLNKTADLQTLE